MKTLPKNTEFMDLTTINDMLEKTRALNMEVRRLLETFKDDFNTETQKDAA